MNLDLSPKTILQLETVQPVLLTSQYVDRKARQYGRLYLRAQTSWNAYNAAIDNLAPRETIAKLGTYAEAMEELVQAAFAKWDTSKAAWLATCN